MESKKQIQKAICPLPWMSLSFNTDSSVRVCCNTDHGGFVKNGSEKVFLDDISSLQDIADSDTMKSLKANMLGGVRSDFCKSCYAVEDAGGMSVRQYYVKKYHDEIERILTDKFSGRASSMKFIDFSLSNNCNLKCRMCSPGASYGLSADFKAIGMDYSSESAERAHSGWKYDGLIRNIVEDKASDLSDILFTGGEPLTNPIHLKILEALTENGRSKHVALSYHSNLMILPDHVLDLWKLFKKVDVHLSLEGNANYNDYIRHKSDFQKIIANLEKLFSYRKKSKLWIEIHTVFQAYNFLILPEYLEYLKQFEKDIPCFPHFIWIDNPDFLSVNSLPPDVKLSGAQALNAYLDENEKFYKKCSHPEFVSEKIGILRACLARMNYSEDKNSLEKFKVYTEKLDRLRGQNVAEVFPALKGVFSQL